MQTLTAGLDTPYALVFDGSSMWVQDIDLGLMRLGSNGEVLQTIPDTAGQGRPVFDGANIWVPRFDTPSVVVVRAATGDVVARIDTIVSPYIAAFDGQRILVAAPASGMQIIDAQTFSVSDLITGGDFFGGVCSDGINFWLTSENDSGPFLGRF